MKGFVYLFRDGDLHNIGISKDVQYDIKRLNPDEVVKIFEVSEPRALKARLFRRYKEQRIPDSTYFRLSKDQINDCVNQLNEKGKLPLTLGEEVKIGLNALIIFFFVSFPILIYLGNGVIFSFAISISLASLPMWILSVLGNFGGYDTKELPLFSSWPNRSKGLFIAVSMNCISYVIYLLLKYIEPRL
tara:strand:+ start:154 stop:717 length:564 start_codon:yes stop_codon:yes gene_type:complete